MVSPIGLFGNLTLQYLYHIAAKSIKYSFPHLFAKILIHVFPLDTKINTNNVQLIRGELRSSYWQIKASSCQPTSYKASIDFSPDLAIVTKEANGSHHTTPEKYWKTSYRANTTL